MPELIEPDAGRHSAWLDAHREWGPGRHEDGFGIGPRDEVDSATGFATWALGRVLQHAREAGRLRVLLVCADDNAASIRTIERLGGVLARTADDGHGRVRHYWIDL